MKIKVFIFVLVMLSFCALASADSNLTWGLTHKMEFTLLLAAVLALCFAGRAQAEIVPTEFRTLRFLVQNLVEVNSNQFLIEVTVIVEPT